VHVVDATAHLNEKVKSRVFRQKLFLPDQIKQVAFAGVFQSQVNCGFVFEAGIQPTDVLMIQLLLNADLADQGFLDFGG